MRILFDSGSQKSYISEYAQEKLRAPAMKSEKLLIKTFGQQNEHLRTRKVVELSARRVLIRTTKFHLLPIASLLFAPHCKIKPLRWPNKCTNIWQI